MEISVTYDGQTKTAEIVAGSHANIIDIKLDVYYLSIRVLDQKGKPVEGAKILVNNFEGTTDSAGLTIFRVSSGTVNVMVYYGGGERSEYVEITADKEYSLSYFTSGLVFNIQDDQGNPLDAIVLFSGEEYQTESGTVTIEDVATQNPEVTVIYEGREKKPQVSLTYGTEYTIIFDIHPPTISSISADYKNEVLTFSMEIRDEGKYASGVNPNKIVFEYNLGSEWDKGKVFYKSGDTYTAEITGVKKDSVILYKISVEDLDGVIETKDGSVSVFEEQPIENNPSNGNGGDDENGEEKGEGGFSFLPIIAGILVLGVLAYLAWTKVIHKPPE
jgi:hypothetical protein